MHLKLTTLFSVIALSSAVAFTAFASSTPASPAKDAAAAATLGAALPIAAPATDTVSSTAVPATDAQAASPAAPAVVPTATAPDVPAKPIYNDDKLIVIGTGSVTGVYYPAGGSICRLVNRERRALSLKCAVESTPGSLYNLTAMKGGEIELAIVQSDWEEHAFNGTSDFAKIGRMDKLRFVMSLHNEAVTLVVQKKSPIAKFDDIQGKIVNIGPDGSGVKATMNEVFKAKGWSAKDFKSLSDLKPNDQPKALCDGTIDVMVVTTGHPNGSVQDVANMCDVKIIDADDAEINKMVQSEPEFSETVIPGGIYPGVPADVKTFGVKAVLVTNADVSDSIIYSITKLVFENIDTFKTFHPVFAQLTPVKMATEGKTVPYHPGALKYYNEKGIVKP